MERHEIVVDDEGNYCGLIPSENGSVVKLADAQATVEALQAQLEAAERHNTILQDANKVALEKVEALQRERDHAKKMEAVQTEVADNQTWHVRELRAALDAEREKVKGLHEITKVICTHCCEPMEIPSKAVLQTQLTQLQALVQAAEDFIVAMPLRLHNDHSVDWKAGYNHALYDVGQVLAGKRTLDATTPAHEQTKATVFNEWGGALRQMADVEPKGGDGE